jgi:hypothetical protein
VSPNFKARIAGAFYLLAVLTAVFGEFTLRGRSGIARVVVPVSCYIAVTLLLYSIFREVNKSFSLLAVSFGLLGLILEVLQLQPLGVNIGMVFHGFFCLLIGFIILKSTLLPRILGALMVFAGLVWLLYFSPSVARFLSPYNTALGLLGEATPMLWLLVKGVNASDGSGRAVHPASSGSA